MKKILEIVLFTLLRLHLTSCGDVDIISPPGPVGLSAYNEWVKGVKAGDISWGSGTDLGNFFKFLKGEKGIAGASAYQVWQEYIKTGTVEHPQIPGAKWDPTKNEAADFYSFLTGAQGDAGLTPHINAKGNWQIGNRDTGIVAKGKNGQAGVPGQPGVPGADGLAGSTVKIGVNGTWEIEGLDTDISVHGKDAAAGLAGMSAYEIWTTEVAAGNIKDKQGNPWPVGSVSLGDFWNYLASEPPVGKLPTRIKFIKSEVRPTDLSIEVFEFETEPEADVMMESGSIRIVGKADETGKCFISYPNDMAGNTPVFATALKAGKAESPRLLLVVKAHSPYFQLADNAIWLDENDDELAEAQGEYRPHDEIPFLFLRNSVSKHYKVRVNIDLANVKEILVYASGAAWNNFFFYYDNPERTKGHVLLWRTTTTDPDGTGENLITFRIINTKDVAIHKQLRIKTTY